MPEYMKFVCSEVTCSLRILSNLCFCFCGMLVGEITATQHNDPTRRIRTLTRFCLIQASLDAYLIKKKRHAHQRISHSRLFRLVFFYFFIHKIISYSYLLSLSLQQLAKLQLTAKWSK